MIPGLRFPIAVAAFLFLCEGTWAAEPGHVRVMGASRSTSCAEEDNVFVPIYGDAVAGMRIEATHPDYIHALRSDQTAPDFTHCDMREDPVHRFEPRSRVLYEDAETRLVGHTFASFWRPTIVPFTVGETVETGLHLVQLLRMHAGRFVEILVLYPADGYWRPKPLPPVNLPDSAFGSSFLVGPIEDSPGARSRPIVQLTAARFHPADLTFEIDFARGGTAVIRVTETSQQRLVLDVRLEPPLTDDRPFAALRSMFVTDEVADIALASWQPSAGASWSTVPVLALGDQAAVAVRFSRQFPSSHNSSAPDLTFSSFLHSRGQR